MEVRQNPEKYARNASNAAGDYLSGAQSPRRSQSAAAIAAEPNYEAGVQAAISRKAYSVGLRKAGDAAWQKGITEVGRARYQQGVANAKDDYAAGFAPYASVLGGLSLPPRGPKGTNYQRVQAVGDALRAKKLSG
jgi:hypothetical protein